MEFLDQMIHPNCGQKHSKHWTVYKRGMELSNTILLSLLPDCVCNVTSCLTLLLPCLSQPGWIALSNCDLK